MNTALVNEVMTAASGAARYHLRQMIHWSRTRAFAKEQHDAVLARSARREYKHHEAEFLANRGPAFVKAGVINPRAL